MTNWLMRRWAEWRVFRGMMKALDELEWLRLNLTEQDLSNILDEIERKQKGADE
jgi:hypothetical protein